MYPSMLNVVHEKIHTSNNNAPGRRKASMLCAIRCVHDAVTSAKQVT